MKAETTVPVQQWASSNQQWISSTWASRRRWHHPWRDNWNLQYCTREIPPHNGPSWLVMSRRKGEPYFFNHSNPGNCGFACAIWICCLNLVIWQFRPEFGKAFNRITCTNEQQATTDMSDLTTCAFDPANAHCWPELAFLSTRNDFHAISMSWFTLTANQTHEKQKLAEHLTASATATL